MKAPLRMKRTSPKPIPRLLLTSALITTLTLISILTFFVSSFASNLKLRTGLVMSDYLKLNNTIGCETHPERFEIPLESGGAVFAYDPDSFVSANPNAPQMPKTLIEDLKKGTRFPLKYNLFSGDFGYFGIPLNAKGPCGLLLMKFRDYRDLRMEAWLLIFGMLLLSCFVIAAIGFFWLLRPGMRRVATLTRITKLMGNDEGFPDKTTAIEDEFSLIERGLHRAHIRLLKDRKQLVQTAQVLRHHLNDVAHDLRTPIASLQLALEQLRDDTFGQEKNPWLTTAIMDAVFLEGLTDNLRIEAQLREGMFTLRGDEKVDLVEVVQRIAARFNLLAQQREMTLAHAHPDGQLWVAAHAVLAERALGNIVHNAIRHGNAGDGHIAIILDSFDDTFTLSVLDDGPGIQEENLQKVRERQFRGDHARQRDETGQGLGLSIAQAFVDQSHFQMDFKTNHPKGLQVEIKGKLLKTLTFGKDN